MGWIEGSVEILDAEGENYIEIAFEVEYDFQPYEPAVMDVNSPFAGPGCDASADLIESSIRRKDGKDVSQELIEEVQDWWRRTGEAEAIEREEERRPRRRR